MQREPGGGGRHRRWERAGAERSRGATWRAAGGGGRAVGVGACSPLGAARGVSSRWQRGDPEEEEEREEDGRSAPPAASAPALAVRAPGREGAAAAAAIPLPPPPAAALRPVSAVARCGGARLARRSPAAREAPGGTAAGGRGAWNGGAPGDEPRLRAIRSAEPEPSPVGSPRSLLAAPSRWAGGACGRRGDDSSVPSRRGGCLVGGRRGGREGACAGAAGPPLGSAGGAEGRGRCSDARRPFTPTFCGPPLGPRRARMERGAGPGAGGASPRDSGGPPPAPAPRPRQVLPGVSGDFPDFLTFPRFQRSCGV